MSNSPIGKNELLGYLAKARVIKNIPQPIGAETYKEGIPQSDIRGVEPVRSVQLAPSSRLWGWRGKQTIQPNRHIEYRVLRKIAEKAWLINTIILHQQNKIRPFMKLSTDENKRGWQLRLKDLDKTPSEAQKKRMVQIQDFILKTGFGPDPERRDNFTHFAMKAVRDYYTLDQLATELQRTAGGKVFAYWAVDPATIIRCTEQGYDDLDAVRYVQEVDQIPTAYYTDDDLIFDFGNPRSDIEHSGYGYSLTEQAIDLILAQINAFWYNASAMTEDNLPRGMLLLNGDSDLETVEAIEEYIIDIMSAGPGAKWKIPIIPSGMMGGGSEGKKALEWVNFRSSNRDQEYVEWTDHLWSAVGALFGIDLEELGIRTKKTGPVLNDNVTPRIEESKSRGLSSVLSFVEDHVQKIIEKTGEDWIDFEFIGYERDDPKAKSDQREADLRTYKSIDEIRVEADMEPFDEEWSKIPLNPQVVQMVMADKQAAQMAAQGGMAPMGGEMPNDPRQGPEGDEDYRRMALGEDDDGESDDSGGGWGNQQEAQNPKPAKGAEEGVQKALADDVIEIII